MKRFLYKLFIGDPAYNTPVKATPYSTFLRDIYNTWNNKRHHDTGLEKLLRLFLVGVQVIFPGMHLMQMLGTPGIIVRNIVKELYVVFKTALPFIFLSQGYYHNIWAVGISVYLMAETVLYVISMIFVSDIFVEPRSYRRNLLMLLFNYLEICLSYAVVYGGLNMLGGRVVNYVDYIYFSIITSTTIGYGDVYPITNLGKWVVGSEAILSIAFVGLFLNFFGSKMERTYRKDDE